VFLTGFNGVKKTPSSDFRQKTVSEHKNSVVFYESGDGNKSDETKAGD